MCYGIEGIRLCEPKIGDDFTGAEFTSAIASVSNHGPGS